MAYNTGIITEKTYHFALRIVKAYRYLREEQNEYVLSKQMLRSGTSIGANCKEAIYAQSTLDFINKLSIALKEASETEYWLDLLHDSQYIDDKSFESIHNENIEIIKLLTSIIKTTKSTL
jgi:four helix bundle protein